MEKDAVIFRVGKKDEYRDELLYIIGELRRKLALSRTMRDGIRLMWDLMIGRTDILLELFPHVRDALCPPPDDKLREDIAELKRMILEQGRAGQLDGSANGLLMSASKPPASGLKAMAAPQFAMPVFDDNDDLPTVIIKNDTSINSAKNLIDMAMRLQ